MGFECHFGTRSTLKSTLSTAVSLLFASSLVILPRIVQIGKRVRVLHIGRPTSTRSVPRASGLVQTRLHPPTASLKRIVGHSYKAPARFKPRCRPYGLQNGTVLFLSAIQYFL